jgi:hypothetical protein
MNKFRKVVINQSLKGISLNKFAGDMFLKDISINNYKLIRNGVLNLKEYTLPKIENSGFAVVPIIDLIIPNNIQCFL